MSKKIIKKLKNNKISIEDALSKLVKRGYCPAVVYDDFGHWAVTFTGFQSIPLEGKDDVSTSFLIRKKQWKKTIRKALIYALKQ